MPLDAVSTDIPARLDRLRWSRFHGLLVVALGISWMLDGLEVTIVGAMGGVLEDRHTLHLSAADVAAVASFYITGAVLGALGFGWLTDRYGRRRIFFATLGCYIAGVALTACSWNFLSFALFRLLTGIGIGGEYAAVNSAIDELMPARLRGRLDRPAQPAHPARRSRLALRFWHRRRARARRDRAAQLRAGKPALAGDARAP
jgi:MFS family permease